MGLCRFFWRFFGGNPYIPPLRNACNRFHNVDTNITTTAGEIVIFVVEVGSDFMRGIDANNHIVLVPYSAVLAVRVAD
ncbi:MULTISPECIES: hypothetical protein [Brevibacillus]|uniref:hypothetical protein n=1 Tax=Brevibacillus TaxID=55080 RepID=UPI000240486A|nr:MULTISPECIES: hypothetical protein [Brevibacillus]AUM65467.1 hypothetical protein C0R09_13530 [Brevibacillus laterosporus]AYK08473.1 hypothetical protein D8Z77_20055 [Brevibacillus laterosporus]MBA4532026.1 hypothetical protein [Brevibacillus halotolerans]MCR8962721.1 hypothetical protein [Brevibacillus laterosporus]MCZ0834876.1 hypothetical protein [Brevibacillus halotolerans]